MSIDRTRIKSRPATRADVRAIAGKIPPYTVRARVLEIDGELVGMAGYWMAGSLAVMFSDMKGDIPAITIWRESLAFLETMKVPAICVAQDGSGRFLKRLGWKYVGDSDDGEVYSWQLYSQR